MKTMPEYFFLRPGFERFQLEPEVDSRILIGDQDRADRDAVLNGIEDGAMALEGYTAVIYGDYGRGKTHECRNIMAEVQARKLPVRTVYVKCHEFKAKEPFSTLFSHMLQRIGTEAVGKAAVDYERLEQAGTVPPLGGILQSDYLLKGFKGLAVANPDNIVVALRWLGGEKGIDTSSFASKGTVPSQLTVSRDFALVMKGMAQLFKAKKEVLEFLIDEAEQIKQVKHPETLASWVGCIRALTESLNIGYVFFVGALGDDDLPELFVWDEIRTRIGKQNYRLLGDLGLERLRQWTKELFATLVLKGPVPKAHEAVLPAAALDSNIPPELQALCASPADLEAYPFTPTALEEFTAELAGGNYTDRPREVLKRIQSAAKRAMRLGQPRIDEAVLNELRTDRT